MTPLGEWLPDIPEHNLNGLTIAKNVIPWDIGYRSFPSANVVSSALTGQCLGSVSYTDTAGNPYTYAGDATKLYLLASGIFNDVSKVGGYAATGWEFSQFGNTVIAVDGVSDPPQVATLGSGVFANLAGSPPNALHVAVVRNFVVLGNVTSFPNAVQWSGINNSAQWTVGLNQSDIQKFPNGGWVQKVVGGEYGVIIQESQISRMTYVGTPSIFQFDTVEKNRGCVAVNSVVALGNTIFYLAEDGFYMFDGTVSRPIGQGKIDKWFYSDLDQSYFNKVSVVIDPINKLVMWAFPGSGSISGICNRTLIFNWTNGRWAYADFDSEILCRYLSAGLTMDSAAMDALAVDNLDSLTPSLDSRYYTGGASLLAGFDTSHRLVNYSGTALDAVIALGDIESNPGGSAFLSGIRPLYTGSATSTTRVGSRDLENSSLTYSPSSAPTSSTGFSDFRIEARYQRPEITLSGDFTNFYALDMKTTASGMR